MAIGSPLLRWDTAVDSPAEDEAALAAEIGELRRRRHAVILAHNYQIGPVQDIADYVGDSLGLSRQAAATDASVIIFCGVHFMAETASVLSPEKTVLLPDLEAGCSLADAVDVDQLKRWKAAHPGAVVVSYVNTTAEVKAESDFCCTSGNALKVVQSIPGDKEILFLPDFFLGSWIQKVTGRRMHIWMGECHVHAAIRPEEVRAARAAHPDAELLVHPECGCTTPVLYAVEDGSVPSEGVAVVSTEGMIQRARAAQGHTVLVATEVGVLHRMRKEAPGKRFVPVSDGAVCGFMKRITLTKVRDALADMKFEVRVPAEIAERARLPIDRMLAIG